MAFDASLARALNRIAFLARAVDELALLPRKVAIRAQPKLEGMIRQQFVSAMDPYGHRWAPITAQTKRRRKARPNAPPLTDTRRLRDGTHIAVLAPNRKGLVLKLGADYGYFHQVGTSTMPARRIWPQYGLPHAWRAVIAEAVRLERDRALKAK